MLFGKKKLEDFEQNRLYHALFGFHHNGSAIVMEKDEKAVRWMLKRLGHKNVKIIHQAAPGCTLFVNRNVSGLAS